MTPPALSWEQYDAMVAEGREHTLLDVREEYEWERGHVPTARHIPHREVTARTHELLPDKTGYIITCCQAGSRAARAAADLANAGYQNVAYIVGAPGNHYREAS